MSRHDIEFCPNCGSVDTVLAADDYIYECLDCGDMFAGTEYDGTPKQIRVKKPYRPASGKDGFE